MADVILVACECLALRWPDLYFRSLRAKGCVSGALEIIHLQDKVDWTANSRFSRFRAEILRLLLSTKSSKRQFFSHSLSECLLPQAELFPCPLQNRPESSMGRRKNFLSPTSLTKCLPLVPQ